MLLNNAGAIFNRRDETPDGLERTFALNHMNYYVLTRLLEAKLRASAPMRIVNVASGAHRGARLDFDDLQMRRRFDGWLAYRNSKLCNILFTRELARRLAGSGITANCLHPGFVATALRRQHRRALPRRRRHRQARHGDFGRGGRRDAGLLRHLARARRRQRPLFRQVPPGRAFAAAQDDAAALRLWQESARIAGLPA